MSKKRLQVVLDTKELQKIRRAAKSTDQTVSEWVRGALKEAYRQRPGAKLSQKLERIRAAARYDFPAPDIDEMNAEITQGYVSGWQG